MGREGVFHKPLIRVPLDKWHPYEDAGGVHEGIQPKNVHPRIFKACQNGKYIDSVLYEQLHTTIDLDGLLDILEMKEVLSSWKSAELRNLKERNSQR